MHGILSLIPRFFYSPDDAGGTSVENLPEVPSPSDADLDVLEGDEDEEEEGKEEKKEEKSEEEETDEEETDEEEGEEKEKKPAARKKEEEKPDIEEEEETEEESEEDKEKAAKPLDKVPSIKALKEAYPDIFKKFPHVRNAIAEHQQFRNVFSSVKEAEEASKHQDAFLQISDSLFDGKFDALYDEMAKEDPEAAARLARNVLPTLMEKNRELYLDITETPLKQFLVASFNRAKSENNKNLMNSSMYLWKFLTGKFENPSIDNKPDPRDEEFNKRVEKFNQEKHQDAQRSVNSTLIPMLESEIERAIDPRKQIKETTRKALIKHIRAEIDGELVSDENHMARLERLWTNARRSSYGSGHLSRITNAYLERARQLLPKYAKKVRDEHGIKLETAEDKNKSGDKGTQRREQGERPPARPMPGGGVPRGKTLRDTNARDIDWSKSKDEDILGGRAFLKRR